MISSKCSFVMSTVWTKVTSVLDSVCLELNSCYTRFPYLFQIQMLSSFFFAIIFMILSKIGLKLLANKLQGLILAVVIISHCFIIISNYYSRRVQGPTQQQQDHSKSWPVRRLAIQWLLHTIINDWLAKEIERQSEWADWFLIYSVFAYYCHVITFVKIMGYLHDVGAADALLSLGVLISSKVLQGPNLRFLGFIIFMMVVMLKEHRAALKEEEQRKSRKSQTH